VSEAEANARSNAAEEKSIVRWSVEKADREERGSESTLLLCQFNPLLLCWEYSSLLRWKLVEERFN